MVQLISRLFKLQEYSPALPFFVKLKGGLNILIQFYQTLLYETYE